MKVMAVCYRLYGLRNYIQTHDVVELENDISRGSGQYQLEIEIVKNITIDGKGHTINGDTGPHYQGRIFLVKENATLILKNLILIDSYCQSLGGVILCLGNIICYNCTFKNNIGEYDGGAICSQNGIEVYDSVFENNRLELSNNGGGALFAFKDIICVNTIFINNNVGEKMVEQSLVVWMLHLSHVNLPIIEQTLVVEQLRLVMLYVMIVFLLIIGRVILWSNLH